METMKGADALRMAEEVSRLGGDFDISFFPVSKRLNAGEKARLETYQRCICRKPLPHDKFSIDGKNFFLFLAEDGRPKSCYRVLIRFMAFSNDGYKLKRITWYE